MKEEILWLARGSMHSTPGWCLACAIARCTAHAVSIRQLSGHQSVPVHQYHCEKTKQIERQVSYPNSFSCLHTFDSWQSAVFGNMSAPTRSISALVARILTGFETISKVIESRDAPKDTAILQTYLARFKLWAGSMGAHRVSGTRSLEYRLRDASSMREHVLSLLEDLESIISESELVQRIGKHLSGQG